VLASPRRRRKALRLGIALAAAGAVALGVTTLSSNGSERKEVFDNRPVKYFKPQKQIRLTVEDRRAIDAVIGRFVSAGVERRDPLAAYALSTRALRRSATRAEWRRGALPVMPYKAAGPPGWHLDYAYPGDAVIDVVLRPAKDEPTKRAIIYTAELKRERNRWLVESMVPSATFGDGTVYSRVDMGPQAVASAPAKARLSKSWIYVPIGLIAGLVLLVPAGIGAGAWLRNRRISP
jgi:hypothetical protein